jgi:biopolymer transport protein ExbD
MPEVNLVPLMDVVMSVLTFFIIISMTLRGQQQVVEIGLPSTEPNPQAQTEKPPEPLVIELTRQGGILLGGQALSQAELAPRVRAYLAQNPKGSVLLNADSKLPYRQVVEILSQVQAIGGDRVSLSI